MKSFVALLAASLFAAFFAIQPAQANGGWYTVHGNDTLYSIALQYGVDARDLAQANGLPENAWLYAGQQLIIPDYGAPAGYNRGYSPYGSYTLPGGDNFGYQQPGGFARLVSWRDGYVPQLSPDYRQGRDLNFWPQPDFQSHYGYQPVFQGQFGTVPPQPPGYSYQTGPAVAPYGSGERWIDVNLSTQRLVAYEGQRPVFRALVSTGMANHPTVVGTYQIYVKYEKTRMTGGYGDEAYDLPDVPYVMYFHEGYGLHGTYWHNNFGTPMSHGCVNLSIPDANWLYNWAATGTKVVTHY